VSRAQRIARLAAGMAGAGATGYAADRLLGRRRRAVDLDRDDHLGSLRGTPLSLVAEDGVRLHVEIDERSPYAAGRTDHDLATVVFVHGFALNLDCWHFQRLAFRGKRRMIFFDQRSHGRSDVSPAEDATIEQLGKDLRQVVDEFSPDRPVVLVGHSMGGMTLVSLAEEHPEYFGDRVVGAALISTTAGRLRTHKMLNRYIPDALGRRAVERGLVLASQRERLLDLVRQRGNAVALGVIREFAFGETDVPLSWVVFVNEMIAGTPLKVLVEFIPHFDNMDKFAVIKAFETVPTLIMCGTQDKMTSVGHSRKLHSLIDGSRLVELRGGGHMPLLEFKDRMNQELDQLFVEADRNMAQQRAHELPPAAGRGGA
jgi:pimeloyl-ACP methyl ester carboxylesterase